MDNALDFVKKHWMWFAGGIGLYLFYKYEIGLSSGSSTAADLTAQNTALAAANESTANAGTVDQMNYDLGMASYQSQVDIANSNNATALSIAQNTANEQLGVASLQAQADLGIANDQYAAQAHQSDNALQAALVNYGAQVQVANAQFGSQVEIAQIAGNTSTYNTTVIAQLEAGQYAEAIQAAQNITAETLAAQVTLGTEANETKLTGQTAAVKTAQIKGQTQIAQTMSQGYSSVIGSIFGGIGKLAGGVGAAVVSA